MNPLAIDLFCGLGGWTSGLLAEGYEVIGFDIEQHVYGDAKYPAQLVVQDVLTLHGSQFKSADLIVASPPCQEFSYMAMPWSKAKAKAKAIRSDTTGNMLADLTRLFDACFRIQKEASITAGRHIPMVVENVRGAIPWVGRSRWNFGSFHLWGDVPALMPPTMQRRMKSQISCSPRLFSERTASTPEEAHALHYRMPAQDGQKVPGFRFDGSGKSFQTASVEGIKGVPHRPTGHWTNPNENGLKCGGDWFNADQPSISRLTSSKSNARKAASAMIAKIPLPLSRHIARTFHP